MNNYLKILFSLKKEISHKSSVFTLLLLILFLQSCADFSNDPIDANDGKVTLITPTSNGNLQEGNNNLIYSLTQPYSIKFIELYVNGIFVKNIPPNTNGTAPQITLNLDSTDIGKTISLYLIYYDNNGTSSRSNIVNNVTITGDLRVPFKPYNLSLTSLGNGNINISWKDSSKNVDKYELWRKVDFSGSYQLHCELSGKDFNTNDLNLDSSKIYFYKIRGVKSSGSGEFSDEINSEGVITSGNLIPPNNLIAVVTGLQNIKLSWNDNSNNENYFSVERSTSNLIFKRIAALNPNTITYIDSGNGLTQGLIYYYRIKSFSNSDSAISNTVQIKLSSSMLIAPSNLTGNYNSTVGVIELEWNNNDNNIVYIDIEKKTESTSYAWLRRVNGTTTLFLDFSVSSNQIYTYRIRGYDLNTFSEYSNEVIISTF